MNKTGLASAMTEKAAIFKKDTGNAADAIIDVIIETVAKEERVQLISFGTFEVRSRNERQGHDPRINSPITVLTSKIPALKAGKVFKDATDKQTAVDIEDCGQVFCACRGPLCYRRQD